MYKVKELWKELLMECENNNKVTEMQNDIFNFCKQYSGIQPVNELYKKYKKCSKSYFTDVIGTRWSVFKEDNKFWIDFDTPVGIETWKTMEPFS